jgi:hypothetical protein
MPVLPLFVEWQLWDDRLWRKAAIPNVGRVGMAEDRICLSKGHQMGTGRVDNVGLREAVALSNASRAVGSSDL